jgi:hypothetical protein
MSTLRAVGACLLLVAATCGPARALELGVDDRRLSSMGADGDPAFDAGAPQVAANATDHRYLVVWQGDDDRGGAVDDELEIFAQLVTADGVEIGDDDRRVSFQGGSGDPSLDASQPAVVWNPLDDRYLVVWRGDRVVGEAEIFGRLLDGWGASLGAPFRISEMGPDGDGAYTASQPQVAHNAVDNEYLVVWEGDSDLLADDEFEIWGRRISAAGIPLGVDGFRISHQGPDGDASFGAHDPAVVWRPVANEYLVVWSGDRIPGEEEIWGQRLASDGAELGAELRISQQGPDGDLGVDARMPAVAHGASADEYLVVWEGDRAAGETEIYGQRLTGAAVELGADVQISFLDPPGADIDAIHPDVVWNSTADEYLVVWQGDHGVGGDEEIHLQGLDAAGVLLGGTTVVSDMGPPGDPAYQAQRPAVAFLASFAEALVVWQADDDGPNTVDGEDEIFAQLWGELPPVDSDGDGTRDTLDCAPADPAIHPGAVEQPCDGVDDDCDPVGTPDAPDGDGDGVCDAFDLCPGFDDVQDADLDGTPNGCDGCPLDPTGAVDGDGDGVCDASDQCAGNDVLGDADGDGVCEDLDQCAGDDATGDADGDGVCDDLDQCPGADDRRDSDFDGTPNDCDQCPTDPSGVLDADGDGICDGSDLCVGNDAFGDGDGDGVCDDLDACAGDDAFGDGDGDGVCDDLDPCPLDDPDDPDGDGVCASVDACHGDDASGDADGDGVCDDLDPCPADHPDDSDSDGVCDGDDDCPGHDDGQDLDGDGTPNGCDACPADPSGTVDVDGDGVCDPDLCVGNDVFGDADGDGVCEDLDLCAGDDAVGDTDGDGVCDDVDQCLGDDAVGDADGDGVCDDRDQCVGEDGSGDGDADGYCALDVGGLADLDCDDGHPEVYPGAPELCDGLDNACSGTVPNEEADGDGDGLAICEGDCDDADPAIAPGAPERCDGLDNDCDGSPMPDEIDADADGVLACEDCDDLEETVQPGALELCDGLDNDCDGGVPEDELDADGDGSARCGGDCDDGEILIRDDFPELCADGLDNDCNGLVDEGCPTDEAGCDCRLGRATGSSGRGLFLWWVGALLLRRRLADGAC